MFSLNFHIETDLQGITNNLCNGHLVRPFRLQYLEGIYTDNNVIANGPMSKKITLCLYNIHTHTVEHILARQEMPLPYLPRGSRYNQLSIWRENQNWLIFSISSSIFCNIFAWKIRKYQVNPMCKNFFFFC